MIVVIEGCDGCGKETQSQLLVKALQAQNIPAIEFSFPMYQSPTGKIFKECVLGKNNKSWFKEGYDQLDPEIVCLYTAADRKYHSKLIADYLQKGYVVVLNRYTSSNMAHQGSKYQDADDRFYMYQWIDKLEYWLLKLPKPDCTILLNLPYRYTDHLKEKQVSFHLDSSLEKDQVLEAYLELAALYNWQVIDCVEANQVKSIDQIHEEIMKIVLEKIKETA